MNVVPLGLNNHGHTDSNKAAAMAGMRSNSSMGVGEMQYETAFWALGAVIEKLRGMQKC